MDIKPIRLTGLTPQDAAGTASQALARRFEPVARALREAATPRTGAAGSPVPLLEAIQEFLRAFARLDADHGEGGALPVEDAAGLADYCIRCLAELATWLPRLEQDALAPELDRTLLGTVLWAQRHDCEIATPDPVVNALANLANASTTRQDLAAVFGLMQGLVVALPAAVKADLEKSNPQRPWRILLLNLAIVAIRAQDVPMMLYAFDLLGGHLPEEAPGFFADASARAAHPAFSDEVRGLLQAEEARWTTRY